MTRCAGPSSTTTTTTSFSSSSFATAAAIITSTADGVRAYARAQSYAGARDAQDETRDDKHERKRKRAADRFSAFFGRGVLRVGRKCAARVCAFPPHRPTLTHSPAPHRSFQARRCRPPARTHERDYCNTHTHRRRHRPPRAPRIGGRHEQTRARVESLAAYRVTAR